MYHRPAPHYQGHLARWAHLLGLLLLGISTLSMAEAERPMHHQHLSVADGLSQNAAFASLQDLDGYIWIATEQGLNRYNGYEIEQYHRQNRQDQGLPDSFVYDIAQDNDGNLWIATAHGGLARWNRTTEQIESIDLGPDANALSLRSLEILQNGELWIGTVGQGVFVYELANGSVRRFLHDPADPSSVADNSIYDFQPTRDGSLWVGTNNGLSRFNRSTSTFTNFRHADNNADSLANNQIRSLTYDHRQQLWIGTLGGGVSVINPLTQSFRHYRHAPDSKNSLSNDHVRAIFVDNEHRIWVGTERGLNLYDEQEDGFRRYLAGQRANELSDDDVLSIMQDTSGLMWIGTRNAGMNIWNPDGWRMGHRQPSWAASTNVTSFAEHDEHYWVGTVGSGLIQSHGQSNAYRQFSKADGLPDNRVMSLQRDSFNQLWIGGLRGGLSRLDLTTNKISDWQPTEETSIDTTPLTAGGIMSMLASIDGSLWIGTFGNGLWRINPLTGQLLLVDSKNYSLLNGRQVTSIAEDADGAVWIATNNGLHRLGPQRGSLQHFSHDRNNPSSLSADAVYALHIDTRNRLWIGTSDGGVDRWIANKSAPQGGYFENLSSKRLRMNAVYGIQCDKEDNLWISGNTGLAKYDPETDSLVNFGPADGLQGAEFNFGAHYRGRSGHLYFGGANGYNRFVPDRLNSDRAAPNLILTEYAKQNQPVTQEAPFTLLKQTSISHDENMLSFEFALLDFVNPEMNRYSYRLEGFDTQWSPFTTQRRATYTNLDAGNYRLLVRATTAAGMPAKEELGIEIGVAPPPWSTPWAYAAYGIFALFVLALIARNQRDRQARAEHISQLAFYDTLTGLPNRHLFLSTTEHLLVSPNRISLLLIGVDRFKRVNETLGHEMGDRILSSITQRLQLALSVNGVHGSDLQLSLARLGGDEFVVTILETPTSPDEHYNTVGLAQLISAQLSMPINEQGLDLVMTASMGASTYPDDAQDLVTLLKHAETAMAHAKSGDRDNFRIYNNAMDERAADRLALEANIRHALETDEFQLHYQPKYSADNNHMFGAEALLRWQRSDGSWVSPFETLSIAQELGFSTNIDRWVCKHACTQLKRWQDADLPSKTIAINLSAASLCRLDFAQWLSDLVDNLGISTNLLELEITESSLMVDLAIAESTLRSLKAKGFSLAIDDFGTGYSSLAYLKQFNVDVLKIDRSFVMDLETEAGNRALCSAIIAMAHNLGLQVIAEGVETPAQRSYLVEQGVDALQGYLLSKPLPASEYESLLLQTRPTSISTLSESPDHLLRRSANLP